MYRLVLTHTSGWQIIIGDFKSNYDVQIACNQLNGEPKIVGAAKPLNNEYKAEWYEI